MTQFLWVSNQGVTVTILCLTVYYRTADKLLAWATVIFTWRMQTPPNWSSCFSPFPHFLAALLSFQQLEWCSENLSPLGSLLCSKPYNSSPFYSVRAKVLTGSVLICSLFLHVHFNLTSYSSTHFTLFQQHPSPLCQVETVSAWNSLLPVVSIKIPSHPLGLCWVSLLKETVTALSV